MDIQIEELPGPITKIVLRGRLDSSGAVEIELPFNTVATEKRAILVDLTAVVVLSSYGVRLLLVGAKICAAKGGKLVILCPVGPVAKVLHIARFGALAPIVESEAAARAALA
jgi:stage II sporulation protein AA (anti-sigma F factor antagonist)